MIIESNFAFNTDSSDVIRSEENAHLGNLGYNRCLENVIEIRTMNSMCLCRKSILVRKELKNKNNITFKNKK